MKKIINFIIEKRIIILILFLLLTILSVWLITQVNVNSDMIKYLPENSAVRIGVEIMEDEFPASSSLNIMFKDISENEKADIYEELLKIENVKSVIYESGNANYNKNGYTLFEVHIGYGAYSDETKTVLDAVNERFSSYDTVLGGDAAGKNLDTLLPRIFIAAFIILFIILFLMCDSWIEPVLFLITIAVAIVINMGSNAMFESVSDITQSIAAVLQLVLSMDYSIMLINRYRQEKKIRGNKYDAMKNALSNAFIAISSSSVTTIVGMLALVFMSFSIGKDLGLVLAKGVLLSLICIFTVLPALILMFDNVIEKTAKKSLHIKMDKLGSFAYKARYGILVFFAVIFAVSFFLRGNVSIDYTLEDFNEINKTFTLNNPIVVLYENKDEDNIAPLMDNRSQNASVDGVNAYATTLGLKLTCGELADYLGMDETSAAMMYKFYFEKQGEVSSLKLTLDEFINFLINDVAANEQFASLFDGDAQAQLNALGNGEEMRLSAEEFAVYGGMEESVVQQIFGYYFTIYGQTEDGKIPLSDLTEFLTTEIAVNEQFAPFINEDAINALGAMSGDTGSREKMSSKELAAVINMDDSIVKLLYNLYEVMYGDVPQGTIAIYDFFKFITEDKQLTPYFPEEYLTQLSEAEAVMDDGIKQLVGENYSRLIINTSFSEESDETFEFIKNLETDLNGALDGDYYIIGNSAMAYEMSESFPDEMNFITILTAVAIFLVVAVAFRSLSVPFVLVCVIQCAIFITMGASYFQGNSIYYLPLLIVQCLLMGATIDYGILYTSYYIEARNYSDKKEAVVTALNNAIHTILTSGLILITVTIVLGFLLANSDPAISQILLTIGTGSFCAVVLVVFILPGLIAALDKFIFTKNKKL